MKITLGEIVIADTSINYPKIVDVNISMPNCQRENFVVKKIGSSYVQNNDFSNISQYMEIEIKREFENEKMAKKFAFNTNMNFEFLSESILEIEDENILRFSGALIEKISHSLDLNCLDTKYYISYSMCLSGFLIKFGDDIICVNNNRILLQAR